VKIRQGFVTNSSSSSFILQFKVMPKTIEDIRSIFFPGYSLDDDIKKYDELFSVRFLCQTLLNDITNAEPKTLYKILKEEDWTNGLMDFYDWLAKAKNAKTWDERMTLTKDWSDSKKLHAEYDKAMLPRFMELLKSKGMDPNCKFITVTYADDDAASIFDYGDRSILGSKGIWIRQH
jgi:hypothetical protein